MVNPHRQTRAILWDLDGTLVDSAGATITALARALQSLGYDSTGLDPADFVGPPLDEALRARGLPSRDIDAARAAYLVEFLATEINNIRAFPGIFSLLDDLHGWEIAQVVVTNRLQQVAERIMRSTALDAFVNAIYGRRDNMKTKRNVVGMALEYLCAAPAGNIILIGDRQDDVDLGNSFGFTTIAVEWGYRDRDEPLRLAGFVTSSVEDLRSLLQTVLLDE